MTHCMVEGVTAADTLRAVMRVSASDYAGVEYGVFALSREDAKTILYLAQLVRDNGLHCVEKYDPRVSYYNVDVTEPLTEGDLERYRVPKEGDRLIVYRDSFAFAAYEKHTDDSFQTHRVGIDTLHDWLKAGEASA